MNVFQNTRRAQLEIYVFTLELNAFFVVLLACKSVDRSTFCMKRLVELSLCILLSKWSKQFCQIRLRSSMPEREEP
jgi:hypothetical protein